MDTHLLTSSHLVIAFATIVRSASVVSAGPAQFVIVNLNAPGVGDNDPTPVVSVGGNTGRRGEQRPIAFHYAASLWTARLDSTVSIRIQAEFAPLVPGVLGSAGALAAFRDFPNAPLPGTWYHAALANKLAGVDLDPDSTTSRTFQSELNFYLGLDNNHRPSNDLVSAAARICPWTWLHSVCRLVHGGSA